MGIAILVIIGAVSAFGVFAFLATTRGSRQHPRRVRGGRNHDAEQYGSLWLGGSAGSGSGGGDWGGSGWGGGGSCGGDGGGGGGSC